MNIAIYGAGSLGTVLGAFLARANIDADLISRNEDHITALQKNGAKISGTVNFQIPVTALLPNQMNKKYDYIFLLTKQQENASVVPALVSYLKSDGVLCTFQNGIPEYEIESIIGRDKTYGCAVGWGAELVHNGEARLTSDLCALTFSLGQFGNTNTKKLEEIKHILEVMGPVKIEDNFLGARWSKLLINCAFSGMSAVLGCTFGEAAVDKKARKYIQLLIKECIDTAKKEGVNLEKVQGKDIARLFDYSNQLKKAVGFFIIPLAIKKHALLKASMLQDLEHKKSTEVDSINGLICKIGKKNGTPAPCNEAVTEIIHTIEKGNLKPSFSNLSYMPF